MEGSTALTEACADTKFHMYYIEENEYHGKNILAIIVEHYLHWGGSYIHFCPNHVGIGKQHSSWSSFTLATYCIVVA